MSDNNIKLPKGIFDQLVDSTLQNKVSCSKENHIVEQDLESGDVQEESNRQLPQALEYELEKAPIRYFIKTIKVFECGMGNLKNFVLSRIEYYFCLYRIFT